MARKSLPLVLLLGIFPIHSVCLSQGGATSGLDRKPVRRVAVIGAGISGLSLAHALTNSDRSINRRAENENLEVSVFDSRESLDYSAGSGVQLNGGLAVLRKINPTVHRAVIDAASPLRTIKSSTKSWGGDGLDELWELSIEKMIRNAGEKSEEELIFEGKPLWYGIMRGALQVRENRKCIKKWLKR